MIEFVHEHLRGAPVAVLPQIKVFSSSVTRTRSTSLSFCPRGEVKWKARFIGRKVKRQV